MRDKDQADPGTKRRFGGDHEWTNEHERRKRNWSEQERRSRKERRHRSPVELEETLAPLYRRFLL